MRRPPVVRRFVAGIIFQLSLLPAAPAQVYTQVAAFNNPDAGSGDEFGISVAAVGADKVLIGAYRDDTVGDDAGSAYLFDRSGQLLRTLHNPDPKNQQFFGFDVAAMNDKLVVTARGETKSGAAYLFDESGDLLSTFKSPPETTRGFGVSAAALGDKVAIGSYLDGRTVDEAGAVYVYDVSGRIVSTIFSPAPQVDGHFGFSLAAMDDHSVVIGAPRDAPDGLPSGTAYVFDASTAQLIRTFHNPTPEPQDLFGISVDARSGRVLVGAAADGVSGPASGAAYLFSGEGSLLSALPDPAGGFEDTFGYSVLYHHHLVLVGSPLDDTAGEGAGAVYVFSEAGILLQTILAPVVTAPGEHFGISLSALDDDSVLIGSHFAGGRFTGPGAAYLFSVPEPTTSTLSLAWIVILAGKSLVLAVCRRPRQSCFYGSSRRND